MGIGVNFRRYGALALVSGGVGSLSDWAGLPLAASTGAVILAAMLLGAALVSPGER